MTHVLDYKKKLYIENISYKIIEQVTCKSL